MSASPSHSDRSPTAPGPGPATAPSAGAPGAERAPATPSGPVTVVVPVFDDWTCASLLLGDLDRAFAAAGQRADVLLIDDGSSQPHDPAALTAPRSALGEVGVLALSRNLGHQRAIAIGLAYLEAERRPVAAVVMDSDGQDRAEDVLKLLAELERHGRRRVIFAARLRREEGLAFRVGYWAYRTLHRVLIGIPVRVGNFSALSYDHLMRFVVVEDAWNHYAASIFKARIPHATLGLARAARVDGRSTMNFSSLILHGLSAISVFGERAGVRAMLAVGTALGLCALFLAGGWTARALGASTPSAACLHAVVWTSAFLALVFLLAGISTVLILNARRSPGFLPARDYRFFVRGYSALPDRNP